MFLQNWDITVQIDYIYFSCNISLIPYSLRTLMGNDVPLFGNAVIHLTVVLSTGLLF